MERVQRPLLFLYGEIKMFAKQIMILLIGCVIGSLIYTCVEAINELREEKKDKNDFIWKE